MKVEEASKLLQLISDPNRLTIVVLLTKKKKLSANEFLASISCKQSTLSHHLNEMVDAKLLKCNKKGSKVFYSLDNVKYAQLLAFLGKIDSASNAVSEEVKPVEEVKVVEEVEEEPKPVVKEEPVRGNPVKIELPFYLL